MGRSNQKQNKRYTVENITLQRNVSRSEAATFISCSVKHSREGLLTVPLLWVHLDSPEAPSNIRGFWHFLVQKIPSRSNGSFVPVPVVELAVL